MIINMNGAKAPETPSPVLQEKTVTPETLPTVIGADEGYDGLSQVTVNPDAQLKAENIRSGKTIFGVDGTFAGEPQIMYSGDLSAVTLGGSSTHAFKLTPEIDEPITLDTEAEYIQGDNTLFNRVYMTAKQGVGASTFIEKYSTDYVNKRKSTDAYHIVYNGNLPYQVTVPLNSTGMSSMSRVEYTVTGNFKLYVYKKGTGATGMNRGMLLDLGEKTFTDASYPVGSTGDTETNMMINKNIPISIDIIIPVGFITGTITTEAMVLPDNVITTTRRA